MLPREDAEEVEAIISKVTELGIYGKILTNKGIAKALKKVGLTNLADANITRARQQMEIDAKDERNSESNPKRKSSAQSQIQSLSERLNSLANSVDVI